MIVSHFRLLLLAFLMLFLVSPATAEDKIKLEDPKLNQAAQKLVLTVEPRNETCANIGFVPARRECISAEREYYELSLQKEGIAIEIRELPARGRKTKVQRVALEAELANIELEMDRLGVTAMKAGASLRQARCVMLKGSIFECSPYDAAPFSSMASPFATCEAEKKWEVKNCR